VEPKLQQFDFIIDCFLVGTARTLEDLRYVSQVEGVVRLVGGRLQLGLHTRVNCFSCLDKLVNQTNYFSFKPCKEAVQNLDEDHRDRLRVKVSVCKEVIVSLKTSSNRGTSTSWGTHSRHKDDIFDLLELFFFRLTVVPAFVVHPLPDQLNRRLSEIDFSLRHVQIIDKNDEFFAGRRTKDTLSALFKFLIQTVLSLVSRSLR